MIAPFVHHWIMARRESLNRLNEFTLIVPYYRNVSMLRRQVEEWDKYPLELRIIVVDDGSPEPAAPHIVLGVDPLRPLELYRITKDIPWNRNGARNLGAHVATTEWIIQIDIDHILPAEIVAALLNFNVNPKRWYRFPRFRMGKADETRKKDKIPDDQEYGEIHPHVDSYLMRRDFYLNEVGGYNEDFSGAIGGGNNFLQRAESLQPVELLPPPIRLEVYTRDVIKDASDWSLSRDTAEYKKRRQLINQKGNPKPKHPLRFDWVREL